MFGPAFALLGAVGPILRASIVALVVVSGFLLVWGVFYAPVLITNLILPGPLEWVGQWAVLGGWGYMGVLAWRHRGSERLQQARSMAMGAVAGLTGSGPAAIGSGSYGSAAWGSGAELVRPDGLIVGRSASAPKKNQKPPLLRYASDGHLLTVAPSRSGKGVSSVVPNLLEYPGSVVVNDIKGENYSVTHARRRELGHQVVCVDPFGAVGGMDSFNPLDLLSDDPQDPESLDEAYRLADMLILKSGETDDDTAAHFSNEAKTLLRGLVLHVASTAPAGKRHLPYVRHLLTLPADKWERLLSEMAENDSYAGVVQRTAAAISQKADRERSGVISTAQQHTAFLDSPRMLQALGASSFDIRDLKRGRLSLYLVLPPSRLKTYGRLQRLLISSALDSLTETPGKPAYGRVLFVLDEFPQLGRMEPVLDAFTLLGGYGAAFWIFVQDLSQLKSAYGGRHLTFLSADVLQAFGTSDQTTAELLSQMTGEATIAIESSSQNKGNNRQDFHFFGGSSKGESRQRSDHGRRLLTPDEVRRLPGDKQLLFVKGTNPVLCDRVCYYEDPEFSGTWGQNPMHAAVA